MNRFSFTAEVARDGGFVVYSDEGGTQQDIVFGGNEQDTCAYIAKRIKEMRAEGSDEQKPVLQYRKRNLRDALIVDQLVEA